MMLIIKNWVYSFFNLVLGYLKSIIINLKEDLKIKELKNIIINIFYNKICFKINIKSPLNLNLFNKINLFF